VLPIRHPSFLIYIAMFVVLLTYKVPNEVVDSFIAPHVEFLTRYYANGKFILSGRKVPRSGGVIVANVASRDELLAILNEDPFMQNDIASYELVEFSPSMACRELEHLKA